jgi:hypothetical protein
MTARRDLAAGSPRLHPGEPLIGSHDHTASLTDAMAVIDGTEHHQSNLRHPLIKAMLPQRAMLMVEQAVQQPLGRFYFGPGTFFLLRKRVARRIVREVRPASSPASASSAMGPSRQSSGTAASPPSRRPIRSAGPGRTARATSPIKATRLTTAPEPEPNRHFPALAT